MTIWHYLEYDWGYLNTQGLRGQSLTPAGPLSVVNKAKAEAHNH